MSPGKHMFTALMVLKGYFPFSEASGVLRYGRLLHGMNRHGYEGNQVIVGALRRVSVGCKQESRSARFLYRVQVVHCQHSKGPRPGEVEGVTLTRSKRVD